MAENFFGIMKSELLYAEKFESPTAFMKAVDEYIDYYKNKIPVKRKESGKIPNSFYNWIMFNQSNFLGALQNNNRLASLHLYFIPLPRSLIRKENVSIKDLILHRPSNDKETSTLPINNLFLNIQRETKQIVIEKPLSTTGKPDKIRILSPAYAG